MVNTVPRFIAQPKSWALKYNGNTAAGADGSGSVRDLLDGGDQGSKVNKLVVSAEGETDDSLILIFLKSSAGTTFLMEELTVSATSAGQGSTADFGTDHTPTEPWIIPSGWALSVGVNTTTPTYNFIAIGGDY